VQDGGADADAGSSLPRQDGALRVAVLGANAWLLTLVLPAWLGAPRAPLATAAAAALPLAALLPGCLQLGAGDPGLRRATWLLLAAFPALLAVGLLGIEGTLQEPPASGPGWLLGLASLAAYVVVAAAETGVPRREHPGRSRPLDDAEALPRDPPATRWLRRGLLTVSLMGAVALVWFPVALPEGAWMDTAWSEAAREARVLVSVVAVALGVAVLTLFVGPALRAHRGRGPQGRFVRRRLATSLVLAALAAAAWLATAA